MFDYPKASPSEDAVTFLVLFLDFFAYFVIYNKACTNHLNRTGWSLIADCQGFCAKRRYDTQEVQEQDCVREPRDSNELQA